MLRIRYGRDEFPYDSCVLALGFFDGVHIAHRELISEAVRRARELGIPAGVFTFSSEGGIKSGTPRIYGTEDRLDIFATLEIDFAIVADFCDVSDIHAQEFVKKILVGKLHTRCAIAGYNFRFGKSALGDAVMLKEEMQRLGGEAYILPPTMFLGAPASSSTVRALLESGDIRSANELLGSPYFMSGEVVHGRGVGKSRLGIPTVNLAVAGGGVRLPRGVYRTAVSLRGALYHGVANLGVCPTYEEHIENHLEVHVIDFFGDVYGEKIKVYFLGYLREEKSFGSEDELKMQINIDKNTAVSENGDIKWITTGQS